MKDTLSTFPTPFAKPQWHERTAGWKQRVLRVIGRDVLLLILFLAVGELAVRMLAPGYKQFIYSDTVTGGHPHVFNSLGLREREFPVTRPDGEARILCLGNSVTRGTGIAQEDTYPKQLEQMLGKSGSPGTFVINGGGEGQSTDRAIAFMETTGLEMNPSEVIFGFSPSMLGVIARQQGGEVARHAEQDRGAKPRPPGQDMRSVGKRILLGSYLYAFLNANARTVLYRLGVLRDRLDVPKGAIFAYAFNTPGVEVAMVEDAYAELKAGLAQLRDLTGQRGIRLTVLGIPPRFEISTLPEDNERGLELRRIRIRPLARLAEYCQELGINYVDVTPALHEARQQMVDGKRAWDDLYVPQDFTHLNATGQRVIAATLLESLRQGKETTARAAVEVKAASANLEP